MKKTLIFTAVAFALAAPVSVYSQALVTPLNIDGTNAPESPDDSIGFVDDKALVGTGSYTLGALSPSVNSPKNSYRSNNQFSDNLELTNGFNDINSDNVTAIGEDGIVAHANDLDQAVATSDLTHVVGGDLTVLGIGPGGNNVVENGILNTTSPLSPTINLAVNNDYAKLNSLGAGAFGGYGGIASSTQNAGSATAVGQSVVVQSNGGI